MRMIDFYDYYMTMDIKTCRRDDNFRSTSTDIKTWALTINPILHGGGPLWPGRLKIVCRFLVDCATLPKFLDFVSFNVLQVSEELFSKKNFFCEKYRTLSKISIGGTLLCKNQNFQKKIFFLENTIFSAWI